MTSGRREKTVRDFVQELDGTGTLTEKLEAANRILHERISPIDNRGKKVELPDPLLAVDLQLNTEEYQWLIELLSEALKGAIKYQKALEKMFSNYPMIFIAALTGTALLDTSDSYWESFWRRMRIRTPDPLYNLLRRELNRELSRKKLATFSNADLIGKDYVGTIRLHAGIPTRDLGFLLELIDETRTQNLTLAHSEGFAAYAVNSLASDRGGHPTSPALRLLATHLPVRATDMFARVYEIHEWYHGLEDKTETEIFEGTHGLPEPTFHFLLKLLSGEVDEQAGVVEPTGAVTYPAPYLHLDPNLLEFHLVFPEAPQVRSTERTAPEWTVLIDDAPTTVVPREDWSTGGYEEHRFPLTKPFAKLAVVVPNGGTHTLVEHLGPKRPMLFLRPSGHVLKHQSKLSSRDTIAILPAAAVISASTLNGHGFTAQDLGPIHGWQDWVARELPLEYVKSLTVSYLGNRERVKVNRANGEIWIEEGTTVAHLKGPDQMPVYRQTPRLRIPEDNSTWVLRYYQLLPTGERLPMDAYEVEDDLRSNAFEVFDAADDPWVGRFQVEVYKDAKLRDRRSFNLAEGLDLKLGFRKYEVNGQFQVPEQTDKGPSLSKALAEFTSEGVSGLRHPQGPKEIHTESPSQTFTIASAEDPAAYSLDVKVDAPRLQYRLPLRDEVAPWSASLQTFNFDELTDSEDFQLRFPSKVNEVELVVSEILRQGRIGRSERISLSRKGNSHVWTTPLTRISSAMESEAQYAVVAIWKVLTIDEFISEKMSKWARKDRFELPRDQRRDPREAAHAPLFYMSKKPLLSGAQIKGDQLELTLGRATTQPLETWVWLVHKPLDPPVQVPMNKLTGTIPAELVGEGTLIVEAREEAFLSFWQPESPSPRAVVADQFSTLEPHLDPLIKHRWLFAQNTERELLPNEVQVVWEARDKLHHVLGRRENQEIPSLHAFDEASSTYLLRAPRVSLEELDKSSIPQERHFEAFLRSGLVTKSFSAWDTAGDIHPVPWIGLIQEMNDLRVLRSRLATDTSLYAERAESEHYIRSIGGNDLWQIFTGASTGAPVIRKHTPSAVELSMIRTQGVESTQEQLRIQALGSAFISGDSRLLAQLEWLDHRRDLATNPRLQELFDAASRWENLIDHLNDPELKRTALDLSKLHEGQRHSDLDNWLYVPYISFVFSFLARMLAHGLIRPVAELRELRHAWATMSRHVPSLTGFDLVAAEAAALYAASFATTNI
ncbi:hypothetical protein [Corynebacterium sp. A21]|uniref:hypothetical protein n=1 Tax=Corynebacterium sp. A21 TaxID=3457318 RepID=UPI003FD1BA04